MKIFWLALFFSLNGIAQELPIQPEETPYLLKPWQIQLENSLALRNETKTTNTIILPNTLFKMGILEKLEFRFGLEHQLVHIETQQNGFNPFIVGFKTKLWKEYKALPEAALVAQTTIPKWATHEFQQDHWAPELQVLLQGNYTESFSMNYNFGTKWDGFTSNPFYTYKITAGYMLTKKWCLYAEVFGHQHVESPSHVSYNNGLMFQINENMMLDVSGGLGINKEAPRSFCALIFSFRL